MNRELNPEWQRAEMLVAFLNVKGEAKQKSGERRTPELQQWGKTPTTVAELLEALQKLRSLLWKEPPMLENPAEWERELERERLEVGINRMLRKYRFRPVVSAHRELYVYWLIANKPRISRAQMKSFRAAGGGIGNMPIDATAAIQIVLEMAAAGALERVRRCHCGVWFLATTLKKAVCSDVCRFKKYQSKDGYKKKRRRYMRDYRILKGKRRRRKGSD
ncbi:MAG: hypothetical protein WCA49_02555 [Candidatus Sulfotelmatobacter sp.]